MNYHFCIDAIFIDDFICDAESTSTENIYVFLFEGSAKFIKSDKGINVGLKSKELDEVIAKIKEEDKVFFHPYLQQISNDIVAKIPQETKVYTMLWGFEFLMLPENCGYDNKFETFLYEPLSLEYIQTTRSKPSEEIKNNIKYSIRNVNPKLFLRTLYNAFNYYGGNEKKTIIQVRRNFLKRLTSVCHWNQFDIDILENLYGIPIRHSDFSYSIGASTLEIKEIKQTSKLTIFLGNSDTITNNHLDALEILKKFKHNNIKIYCPLNYVKGEYAEHIAMKGKKLFGDKFIPLLEFLPRDEYYDVMSSVDICFMHHKRTQAGGNILAFVKKGKKIFLNKHSTIYKLYKKLGMKVYSTEEFSNYLFEELITPQEKNISIDNVKKMNAYFEKDKLRNLKKILK